MAEAEGEIHHMRVCLFDHSHRAPALYDSRVIMGSFEHISCL